MDYLSSYQILKISFFGSGISGKQQNNSTEMKTIFQTDKTKID